MTEPNLQNVAKNFVVAVEGSYMRHLTFFVNIWC